MPFTPFHFGPGNALKALFPREFSLTTFCAAQVMIDLEPGYHLLHGDDYAHGWAHTYLGAILVAAFTIVFAVGPIRWLHRRVGETSNFPFARWFTCTNLSWRVLATSALVGTLSHVLMDSVMHADVKPFAPFSLTNPLLGAVSLRSLHYGCLGCGLAASVYAVFVSPKKA
jgi:hypothetical protein